MKKITLSLILFGTAASSYQAQADMRISGAIQAEISSAKYADGERQTLTRDGDGTALGGGPNTIRFHMNEKLSDNLTAYAQLGLKFSTFSDAGIRSRERIIGLKSQHAHLQVGYMPIAYKYGINLDPFRSTGLQARKTGGGSTGGKFSHNSFIENVVELGFKYNAFNLTLQTVTDDSSSYNGTSAMRLGYKTKKTDVFLAAVNKQDTKADDKQNIMLGGKFKLNKLTLGLRYEKAEMDTLDKGKGDYSYISASYKVGNVIPAAWVGHYDADADNEDALSWSLGVKYKFSKKTMGYLGYHETNSDNNSRDWDAFVLGLRLKF